MLVTIGRIIVLGAGLLAGIIFLIVATLTGSTLSHKKARHLLIDVVGKNPAINTLVEITEWMFIPVALLILMISIPPHSSWVNNFQTFLRGEFYVIVAIAEAIILSLYLVRLPNRYSSGIGSPNSRPASTLKITPSTPITGVFETLVAANNIIFVPIVLLYLKYSFNPVQRSVVVDFVSASLLFWSGVVALIVFLSGVNTIWRATTAASFLLLLSLQTFMLSFPIAELSIGADLGFPYALAGLGMYYAIESNGSPRDQHKAATLFSLAASRGVAAAQNDLGLYYQSGQAGLRKDELEAVKLFKLAAAQGDPKAEVNLGRAYASGRGGVERSEAEAVKLYSLAAAQGDPDGQEMLGLHYVGRDDKAAATWLRRAADQNKPLAQATLSLFYQSGRGGLPRDDLQAVALARKSAEQGNSFGQVLLAGDYANGTAQLPQDDTQAAYWLKQAADQNNPLAEARLSLFYHSGRGGLPRDNSLALELAEKSVEQGDSSGQLVLGSYYLDGNEGLPQDEVQAVLYFKLAADQGNPIAQYQLGVFYSQGRGGLAQSWDEAIKLWTMAANQGLPEAQRALDALGAQTK